MIIHINQTLQSYLVAEKKMIYFLKHAGATKADVDMNIHLLVVLGSSRGCIEQFSRRGPATRLILPRGVSSPPPRVAAIGCLTGLRHINRRLLPIETKSGWR